MIPETSPMSRLSLKVLVLILGSLFGSIPLHGETVYFSFGTPEGGGAASVEIDAGTGKISGVRVLGDVTTFRDAKKLAVTGDGKFLLLTSDLHEQNNLYRLDAPDAPPRVFTLEATNEEIAPAEHVFFLNLSRGRFSVLDPAAGNVTWTWNARRELDPPGHKGESARVLADGHTVLATFQKDGDGREGSRIVVFDLRGPRFLHDIRLPRDRPDLHIEGNPKEQGPNPELIFAATASNTLVYSMDLYGGLGFMDLDAALGGRIANHTRISTASDGSWGTAFPDRGTFFTHGGREWLLISNASENGGYALVDVEKREIRHHLPSPSGGEHPVWFGEFALLASAPSGKIKSRTYDGLEKDRDAKPSLHIFDIAALADGGVPGFEEVPLDSPVSAMARAGRHLVVFTRNAEVLVIEPATRRILDRRATPGRASRVAIHRG